MVSAEKTLKNSELEKLIRPLPVARTAFDYGFKDVEKMLLSIADGTDHPVDLVPDFQRGHVWSEQQQGSYIENVLRGVVAASGLTIKFNAPAWDNEPTGDLNSTVQCIDGLQRLTAIQRFVKGELKAFGLSVTDFHGSSYSILQGAGGRFRMRVEIYTFQNKKDLVQHYLDLNTGGTPHSQAEIERVRAILLGLNAESSTK